MSDSEGNMAEHDKVELKAFGKYLCVVAFNKECGQKNPEREACLIVYGDVFGEGNKPHENGGSL